MSAAQWWGAATVYAVVVVAICAWIYRAASAADRREESTHDWHDWQ
jgi:hypothetical protein